MARLSVMAHGALPDFSRLTMRTDARDTVVEEVMTERNDANAKIALALADQLLAHASQKIVNQDIESVRQAAAFAQQYKDSLDGIRRRNSAFRFTNAWVQSTKRHAAFLERALEALDTLDTDIQADMQDPSAIIYRDELVEMCDVIEHVLTKDYGQPHEVYYARFPLGARYESYRNKLKDVTEAVKRTVAILNTLPDAPNEQILWREDMVRVMRRAASTRTIGEVNVARELENLRRTREGGSRSRMAADREHRALDVPVLAVYMQLVHNLIMDEVNDIRDMIDEQGLRVGQFVEETVEFGDFGIGKATIQVRIYRNGSGGAMRKLYNIRWFRPGDEQAIDIQASIGSKNSFNKYLARSEDDLARFLNWLDQNLLSARGRRMARTWTLRPFTRRSRRVIGGEEEGVDGGDP